QVIVADVASYFRGALIPEGEVKGVCDRFREPAQEIILAVAAAQIGVHMAQRPVPVDARHSELAQIGQKGMSECTALPGESVGALCHPVAEREVAPLPPGSRSGGCPLPRRSPVRRWPAPRPVPERAR